MTTPDLRRTATRSKLCAAAALAALLAAGGTVDAGTAAGCLKTNGQLVQLALADKPLRKCPRNAREVALSMHEPGRFLRFHEVIGFGEELFISDTASGWDQWAIDASCDGSSTGAGVGIIVYHTNGAMSFVNNVTTGQISGSTEGILSARYTKPHMYELAAESGTIEIVSPTGDRVRVEAALVVNHLECIVSGTVELFARAGS